VTRTARSLLMAGAAGALLVLYVWGAAGLPDFGHTVSVTGTRIASAVTSERQTTNTVAAIVFDYRGLDTLGEELILFISVVAVALLLRVGRDQEQPIAPEARRAEEAPGGSDAVRLAGLVAVGVTFLLGLYVIAHGHLTPGGGFQGGAILGSALIAVYAAGDMATLRTVRPRDWMDAVDAFGAAGLVLLALGGLVAGGAFFHNFLPTGHSGQLLSTGIIPLANVAVGIEVVGAFAMLASEVLQDTVVAERQGQAA
jgi:multicomponent Na+:H+ antiporter subunit B